MPIGHPGSPSTIAGGVVVDAGDALLRFGERDGDCLLPKPVLGVQVGCEPRRLIGIVAEAELEREPRVLHASGRVDARSHGERDVGAAWREGEPGNLAERAQPRKVGQL